MAKFNMSDFAKTLGMVPEQGTKQIEYIDIDLLCEDPRNFYEVSGVDELASNIALFGLMDPLLVRSAEDGTVQIVSGHRRHAALRKLVEEGHEELRQVPCIRVEGESSPALQELRLIYANSDTRKMTSADIAKQAERVEQLLYQLKEEGHPFPGRMRDHVAEACKVSKSKLSRLKVIREKLAPDIAKAYWKGSKETDLCESAAYELARLPVDLQRLIVDEFRHQSQSHYGLEYLSEYIITEISGRVKKINAMQCPSSADGACSHISAMIVHAVCSIIRDRWCYLPCGDTCCGECPKLLTCKFLCPDCKEKRDVLKAKESEARKAEKERTAAKERPDIEKISRIWARFASQRRHARVSLDYFFKKLGCQYFPVAQAAAKLEKGEAKVSPSTSLPYGGVNLSELNRWVKAADLLGCSVDFLMMRTDDPNGGAGEGSVAMWQTGTPPTDGPYYVKADHDGFEMCHVVEYNRYDCRFEFLNLGEPLEGKILGWYPLPADGKEEVEDDGDA